MENQPLVSVIVPCYNMEKFIAHTIESVLRQTYTHWELLIVDDASTDRTVSLVNSLCGQDYRIHVDVNTEHSGVATARNHAIQKAQGRFLAFLDADDLWHHEKLERQLQYMISKHIGFCYTAYDCIDEDDNYLERQIRTIGKVDYNKYLRNTIIGCSTVMIDRDIVGEVKVPNYRTSQDTATWLRLLKKGFVAYDLDQLLTHYRVRKHSNSSNKLKAASDLWHVYRDQEGLSLLKASYCFGCYAFNAIKKRL